MMRVLQPRWLLVTTIAAVFVGIALAVWLYQSAAAG